MEEARKKLRICLICIVAAAVIVGAVYYLNDVRKPSDVNEGTLVAVPDAGWMLDGAGDDFGYEQ